MSAHTPGPWIATGRVISGGNPEFLICETTCGRSLRDEDLANARLIAAAPDLLAALIEAVKDVEDHISSLRASHPYKLAITKAGGVPHA